MLTTRRLLLSLLAIVILAPIAVAQEPIRFARTPDLSPDGKLVAFSYLGDIWTVEAIGGVARPITMHEAHDLGPCISPDGRKIAFSSNRFGSYDVFVVGITGGKPKRLTFDSAQETVTGWTPDGSRVVYGSTRSAAYPSSQDVYTVSVDGGQEHRLNLFEGKEAYFAPTGNLLAFVRGPGLWYRKGYRGSSNDDLWLANLDGTQPRKLTNFDGQDTAPMWSPDAKQLYYVSDELTPGVANVVVQSVSADPAAPKVGALKLITSHKDEFVRRARISGDGEWIVYECGADLWMANTKTAQCRKLAIEVHADDKSNADRSSTYTNNATQYSLSPDESHAVLVIHGELFLTKTPGGGKATRLTESPAFDHSPTWAPDGKSILFASDRTGVEELYTLQPDDPEQTELTKATKFKVTKLTNTPDEESGALYSPKGDRISFLRGGTLWLMKPDGTEAKELVGTKQVSDYDWSPDSKYIVYSRTDGSFASELFIVPTDASAPARNVTRYATFNSDVTWSNTGGKIAFVSQRRGTLAMHVLPLQRPSVDGGALGKSVEIEWDDIHQRVERPTSVSAESGTISSDGSQIAFRSTSSGDDLWVVSTDGRTLSRLTTGNQAPRQIKWARRGAGLIYFLNTSGELRAARASGVAALVGAGSSSADPVRVGFSATMKINRDEEFAEMFAQSWRALSDNFYDDKHHGANWPQLRAKYAELVPHVAQREDLYSLVSLMLGELNASHLGISGRLPTPDETTAELGILFDETYPGPGLKVLEVLKRGPADKRGMNLKAGEIIVAIDRVELTAKTNLSELLNNKAKETVRLDVMTNLADAKTKRRVDVSATDRGNISQLMYERWISRNAEQITKESGGTVGYIHIPSMDEAGLEAFVRSLYSDNFDKEAIVVDVRYNGGGFTHDQVLNYLSGKEHTRFVQRNGGEGLVMRNFDRKWNKPLAVVINNRSYSDAEIFPHAFRAIGLGKVVGQATGGHVIGTTGTRLIDGSTFRLPRTGVFTTSGINMEKEGVKPDVAVEFTPADWLKGTDPQLTTAVGVVKKDVVAWNAARKPAATTIATPKPTPPTVAAPMSSK